MFEVKGQNRECEEQLRERAGKLLASGEISAFIGYTYGSIPWMPRPFVARTPEDADKLVWNSFLTLNLSNYLPGVLQELTPGMRKPEKPADSAAFPRVGIVATGCWSRNIVIQIQENQVARERVHIIGIASRGMVSRQKVKDIVGAGDVECIREDDYHIEFVMASGEEKAVSRWELVRENCKTCVHPEPVLSDEILGPGEQKRMIDRRFEELEPIEALDPQGRWQWFQENFKDCIRCYACRNACPLCYCPTCFVDDSRPQWLGKSTELSDTLVFHILRAFHCAGRCTDCGACESVCPVGIPMRLLTKKLVKDSKELFDWDPGMDPHAMPLLGSFSPNDPDISTIEGRGK